MKGKRTTQDSLGYIRGGSTETYKGFEEREKFLWAGDLGGFREEASGAL